MKIGEVARRTNLNASAIRYYEKVGLLAAPHRGGGPPCVWEFEGHLYEHRWKEPNVNFLKGILTVQRVGEVLVQAVEHLVGQPEHEVAAAVQEDFPLCTATLEARCVELPQLLETTQYSTTMLAWSV
jgi:hypothetical protein